MSDKHFEIAPRPTLYNGVVYRSRVEARWAILFDSCGLRHTYEPDSFDIGTGLYVPDFWLPDVHLFVEIKGSDPSAEERAKCAALATCQNRGVLLAVGVPEARFQITWFGPEGERDALFALAHDRFAAGGFWMVAADHHASLGPYNFEVQGGPCFAAMDAVYDQARGERFDCGRCDRRYPAVTFPADAFDGSPRPHLIEITLSQALTRAHARRPTAA